MKIMKMSLRIFNALNRRGLLKWLPDPVYLKTYYRLKLDRPLNLKNPQTFNEKLQWLKLHDRRPEYTRMVDKYEAKKYVAEVLGEDYIIPTLGVWDHFEDIDFDSFPNQFVLKCTHDSGGLVICKDKAEFDIEAAKRKIESSLHTNYYYMGREWPYKHVKPRIIAEQYMSDGDGVDGLTDYKVHCFDGAPKVILVCRDRFKEMSEDFFTEKWEHIAVQRRQHPNSQDIIDEPDELEEMLKLAEKLSANSPFVRTDFYTINGKVFFGEFTLFPASGMEAFVPEEYDQLFGDWITLPIEGGGNTL